MMGLLKRKTEEAEEPSQQPERKRRKEVDPATKAKRERMLFEFYERKLWRRVLKSKFPVMVYAMLYAVALSPRETRPWDLRRACEEWLKACCGYVGKGKDWHVSPIRLGVMLKRLELGKKVVVGGAGRRVLYEVNNKKARRLFEVLVTSEKLRWLFREFWDHKEKAERRLEAALRRDEEVEETEEYAFLRCLTGRRLDFCNDEVRYGSWLWEPEEKIELPSWGRRVELSKA